MRLSTFLSATLLSLCASFAQAQDPVQLRQRSPEEIQRIMAATVDPTTTAMISTMEKMTEAMLEAQLRVAERPETAERLAAFKRNLYAALLKKGFNSEQALQITLATAMPCATQNGR